jgi:hypothetical protein
MTCSGCSGTLPVCSVIAVFARWQSPATTSPPARSIISPSLRAIGTLISAFSARRPHIPSIPLHCCTSLTLAPVSFIRSRLLKPMFWALRWHGVWYVIVCGTSPVNSVSSEVPSPRARRMRYSEAS